MKKVILQIVGWMLLVSLQGSSLNESAPSQWVVWNVGQGSFLTRVEQTSCLHFDAGGERKFPREVLGLCRGRQNIAVFSHSDWDHVSYASELKNNFPRLCRFGPWDQRKRKALERIPICALKKTFWSWTPHSPVGRRFNDASGVYNFKNLLYPGDSPKKFEKFWLSEVSQAHGPKILVLAHHGSRTGTSSQLLKYFPSLQVAVASARKSKYGHPHREVIERLAKAHLPLITTENWGSLHFMD